MNRLFARLVAMFRRDTLRPATPFRRADGLIDYDALSKDTIKFWHRHSEEVRRQFARVMLTLRVAVPGLVTITWEFDQEYGDEGYFEVIRNIELHVRLPDGQQVRLGLPDVGDLHCSEWSYWDVGDSLHEKVDEQLEDAEAIDEDERQRRFFRLLASDYGLVGVPDDDALMKFGSVVASVIDFARTLDTGYTGVPDEVIAMLPPLPPPPQPPAVEGRGVPSTAPEQSAPETHAQAA